MKKHLAVLFGILFSVYTFSQEFVAIIENYDTHLVGNKAMLEYQSGKRFIGKISGYERSGNVVTAVIIDTDQRSGIRLDAQYLNHMLVFFNMEMDINMANQILEERYDISWFTFFANHSILEFDQVEYKSGKKGLMQLLNPFQDQYLSVYSEQVNHEPEMFCNACMVGHEEDDIKTTEYLIVMSNGTVKSIDEQDYSDFFNYAFIDHAGTLQHPRLADFAEHLYRFAPLIEDGNRSKEYANN